MLRLVRAAPPVNIDAGEAAKLIGRPRRDGPHTQRSSKIAAMFTLMTVESRLKISSGSTVNGPLGPTIVTFLIGVQEPNRLWRKSAQETPCARNSGKKDPAGWAWLGSAHETSSVVKTAHRMFMAIAPSGFSRRAFDAPPASLPWSTRSRVETEIWRMIS